MDERQREQVSRLIIQCSTSSRAALFFSLDHARSEFNQTGRSGSGAEMVAIVRAMARDTDLLLSRLVSQIAPVARTLQAFEEIDLAMRRWLRACDDELKQVSRLRQSVRLQERGVALKIGRDELQKVTEDVERRLEIEKFGFEDHASPVGHNTTVEPRKGGRPPAEFWDDMWAAIATALYTGDLKPRSQADVQRAMSEWIEGSGFNAADGTVKARARRLWNLIEASDQ